MVNAPRIVGFCVLFALAACRISPESTNAGNPAMLAAEWREAGGTISVRLGSIRSGMLPGTVIGGEFDAFGAPAGAAWVAPEEVSPEQQARWLEVLAEMLRRSGVRSLVPSAEFASAPSMGEPILHATLRSMRCSLRRAAAGPSAQASALIEWEIVDPANADPLHRGTTLGECAAAASVADAQAEAFREAAKKFLAQPQTASVLFTAKSAVPASAQVLAPGIPVEIPRVLAASGGMPAEEMLARNTRAVFSIRNPTGHGSGFFIRKDGLAITSAHVVEGRRYWDALLADGRMVRVRVLRENVALDLALLQAVEGEFETIPLGDSGAIRLGEEIWAIGTPVSLQFSQSVSRGIVSALRAEPSRTLIQTDTALNPGSSGGPILNRAGDVVGIANLKIRASAVEGIGFATAINDARTGLLLVLK